MMVPKCTSWLGHKYEARYTKKPPEQEIEFGRTNALALVAVIDALSDKIYERDICVRCGHVIERKP